MVQDYQRISQSMGRGVVEMKDRDYDKLKTDLHIKMQEGRMSSSDLIDSIVNQARLIDGKIEIHGNAVAFSPMQFSRFVSQCLSIANSVQFREPHATVCLAIPGMNGDTYHLEINAL